MNRLDTCRSLVEEAMRCLENGDKECVMRKIEELVRADCHNGYAVGREIADKVKDVVHELWLASNREEICGLLRMLKNLNVSKGWVRKALGMSTKRLNKWIAKCGVRLESKVTRNNVVKEIEGLLREKFGWNEVKMCEEMWRFVGVDVDEFRRHGIEPCSWLEGLESLRDLRRPYWFGLARSDLAIVEDDEGVRLELGTTNTIGSVLFTMILSMIKISGLKIEWIRVMPSMKYVSKLIGLSYYVYLSADAWTWPIELSADELERILNGFSDEELAEFIAGLLDGDGITTYGDIVYVGVVACKNCPKRIILDALGRMITERLSIIGIINSSKTASGLMFGGKDAIKLLRRIAKYIHHPLRRLRIELALAYYEGKIDDETFTKLYEQIQYKFGEPDIKRDHGLDVLVRAAPQTHTHGEQNTNHGIQNNILAGPVGFEPTIFRS